jgi:bromodomain adjacent to zinc finger domain protein 1A
MPLLRKHPFKRTPPPRDLRPTEEIFYCEATKEVFRDYEEFFQRTILCNSLVWSCSITGKSNLTYEEAVDAEKKARKRLGTLPKPLKKGLLWTAHHTRRGRISDVVDDVFRFGYNRYFRGEVVEAVIGEMWCDSKILRVIPPTQEEIEKDAQEIKVAEEEEAAEEKKKAEAEGGKGSPSKSSTPKKPKDKKTPFLPQDYLFKYQVQETEPDDPESTEVRIRKLF